MSTGQRGIELTNSEGDEMELPRPYEVYFDSRYSSKKIIIHTREHIKGVSKVFTEFYDDSKAKKPEWVKELLNQFGIQKVGVGQHTIRIEIESSISVVWKSIEEYLKEKVLNDLK